MKPELLFLILFLFGFVLYCFLGNTKAFYKKIEGMDTLETTSSTESPSTSSTAPSTTASVATSSTTTTSSASPSYENYNHYKGTSIATKYYGPNGEVIVINSPYSITVINTSGVSVEYTASISSGSTVRQHESSLGLVKMYLFTRLTNKPAHIGTNESGGRVLIKRIYNMSYM